MRPLAIAYGNSCQAKKWMNKTISYDDLKERLRVPQRTTETAEEYAKMSKSQRDAAKDHGGFVGGVLKGGRRKIDTVEKRSILSFDGDRLTREYMDNFETTMPYTACLYTTHSSTPKNPRARILVPMTRDVTPEEFVAVARYVAEMLGIDYFDECSYQPNQLMYWPSCPQNGAFEFKEVDKAWLDPDDILSAHPEWTDPTQLPTSSRESKANQVTQQKVQNPLEKEGAVGLFNRAFFPISKALSEFLSDVYEPTDNENRWHLITAHSMAGVEIKEDMFVYSHHAKDPAYLKLCNAFDIVRIHKFGSLDNKASYREMCKFAMSLDNLVTIHPWVDGNGRTARLLMNYIQFCYHLFPTKIFKEDREEYILSLRQCQNEETNQPFLDFMARQLKKSLSIEIERFNVSRKKGFSFMF